MATTEEFKVKLVSAIDQSIADPSKYAEKIVVFDVTPSINESGGVTYEPIEILHGPTSFQSYRSTPSRTFAMSEIKLISRTPTEARNNIQIINTLRSWRMPYFGQTGINEKDINTFFSRVQTGGAVKLSPFERLNRSSSTLKERLGAPPEILYFSAFTRSGGMIGESYSPQYRGNIHRVPVVLVNLSINYPNNVTYIPTAKRGNVDALGNVPFPTIMTISIDLLETHSPAEVNNFNLAKYANGVLDGF